MRLPALDSFIEPEFYLLPSPILKILPNTKNSMGLCDVFGLLQQRKDDITGKKGLIDKSKQ
jgi:hypothetical protein